MKNNELTEIALLSITQYYNMKQENTGIKSIIP